MKPYTAMVNGQPRVIDATIMRRPRLHLPEGDIARASLPIKAFQLGVRLLFGLVFRVRVEGRANVPRQSVIICFNHLGWTEAFLVLLYFPAEPRIYGIGHQHVSEISGFRHWLMDKIHVLIPMDISQPSQALRISEEVLRRGGSLLISPEGRLGDPGRRSDPTPARRGPCEHHHRGAAAAGRHHRIEGSVATPSADDADWPAYPARRLRGRQADPRPRPDCRARPGHARLTAGRPGAPPDQAPAALADGTLLGESAATPAAIHGVIETVLQKEQPCHRVGAMAGLLRAGLRAGIPPAGRTAQLPGVIRAVAQRAPRPSEPAGRFAPGSGRGLSPGSMERQ